MGSPMIRVGLNPVTFFCKLDPGWFTETLLVLSVVVERVQVSAAQEVRRRCVSLPSLDFLGRVVG